MGHVAQSYTEPEIRKHIEGSAAAFINRHKNPTFDKAEIIGRLQRHVDSQMILYLGETRGYSMAEYRVVQLNINTLSRMVADEGLLASVNKTVTQNNPDANEFLLGTAYYKTLMIIELQRQGVSMESEYPFATD